LTPDDADSSKNPVTQRVSEFLDHWQHRRWALIAPFLPANDGAPGTVARQIKERFEFWELTSWEITELAFVAAAICEATTRVTVNGNKMVSASRWICQIDDGQPSIEGGVGAWRLVQPGPEPFIVPKDV